MTSDGTVRDRPQPDGPWRKNRSPKSRRFVKRANRKVWNPCRMNSRGAPAPDAISMDVLIIEDQHDIAANIWDFLERRGHRVDHAADGASGLTRAMDGRFDVIVLDLGLPRMDGLELCRRLRQAGHGTPVLMLTARDTLDDKLKGYAEGADDYMIKPFELRELEARLRVLRRDRQTAASTSHYGPLRFDAGSLLAWREGKRIPLNRNQGKVLALLLQDAPRIVSHQRLAQALWGDAPFDVARLHDHLYALRALIDKPFAAPLIQSVHGLGYRLLDDDDA